MAREIGEKTRTTDEKPTRSKNFGSKFLTIMYGENNLDFGPDFWEQYFLGRICLDCWDILGVIFGDLLETF